MEKLRVVIVDDERWIAQLIMKLIHWDDLQMELEGIFHDGATAYEEIMRKKPDIVLTDIRMPMLDGLGMIAKVQQEKFFPHFVIFSGYADFEYAQTAIKYGVLDYILKPVDEEQLNSILLEISKQCKEEYLKVQEEEKIREKVKKSQPILEKEFLTDLIYRECMELDELEKKYYVSFPDSNVRALCLKLDNLYKDREESTKDILLLHNITEILKKYIQSRIEHFLLVEQPNLMIVVILNSSDPNFVNIEFELQNWLTEIKSYVYSFEQYEVTVGISDNYEKDNMREAVRKVFDCVNERLILGTGKIIKEKDIENRRIINTAEIFNSYRNAFINSIQSFNVIQMYKVVDQIYASLRQEQNIKSENYFNLSMVIMDSCLDSYSMGNSIEKRNFEKKIRSFIRISDLNVFLKKNIRKYIEYVKDEKSQFVQLPIRRAKEYVDHHYMEKISLEEVAKHVGLNASYFSNLFKKECDKTFVNYLMEVRLNQAKELLRTTNDTIISIAESVGYTDSRYFSQCFEKVIGMKPSLFRKLYSR